MKKIMISAVLVILLLCCFAYSKSEGATWIPYYDEKTSHGWDIEDSYDKSSLLRTSDGTIEVSTKMTLVNNASGKSGKPYMDASTVEINCEKRTYKTKDYKHSDGNWKPIASEGSKAALYESVCLNTNKMLAASTPDEISKKVDMLIDESSESFQRGDWDRVIEKTTRALYFNPRSEIAYTNRAGAYANKGMLKEAEEDSNSAIMINPKYGLAYNNRGYVYERLGQLRQAELDYGTGCSLSIQMACNNLKRISMAGK
jgi:tetratricopeptide (TPR) repeat protein